MPGDRLMDIRDGVEKDTADRNTRNRLWWERMPMTYVDWGAARGRSASPGCVEREGMQRARLAPHTVRHRLGPTDRLGLDEEPSRYPIALGRRRHEVHKGRRRSQVRLIAAAGRRRATLDRVPREAEAAQNLYHDDRRAGHVSRQGIE